MLQSGSLPTVFRYSLPELETAISITENAVIDRSLFGFGVLERRGMEMRIGGGFSSNPHCVCGRRHAQTQEGRHHVWCVSKQWCVREDDEPDAFCVEMPFAAGRRLLDPRCDNS